MTGNKFVKRDCIVAELRDKLKEKNLPTNGRKKELVNLCLQNNITTVKNVQRKNVM